MPGTLLTVIGLVLAAVLFFTVGSRAVDNNGECRRLTTQGLTVDCDGSMSKGFPLIYKSDGKMQAIGLAVDIGLWVIASRLVTLGVYALLPDKK